MAEKSPGFFSQVIMAIPAFKDFYFVSAYFTVFGKGNKGLLLGK